MAENMKEIHEAVFEKLGHFYVCGEVQMAADVTQTLELILQVLTNISVEQSKERILELKEAGRFHEDIFGNSIKKSPIIKNDE